MHTYRKNGDRYEVGFFVVGAGFSILYKASSEVDAMSVVSYLNGGDYPPLWNPPLGERKE